MHYNSQTYHIASDPSQFPFILSRTSPSQLDNNDQNATKCHKMPHFFDFFVVTPILLGSASTHSCATLSTQSVQMRLLWLISRNCCYENRLRQTCYTGNPSGCPFPAPTRFHPLMWPSQGHGHSEERSDEESTISPPPGADRGRQNGIVAMIQPRLPVIPSAARNLKSMITRPDSQCHAYIVTNSGNQA